MSLPLNKIKEVRALRKLAYGYNLLGVEILDGKTDEELAVAYNGVGPAWFPSPIRAALDRLNNKLLVVAFIHDIDWSYSDGSRKLFNESNARFSANGKLVADAEYDWFDPRRYLLRHKAMVFAELCSQFGWSAYISSYEEFKNRQN